MSISLSLNPMSILDYFRSKENRNRDQVASYLDEIANDAKALAEVWDSVIKDLIQRKGHFNLDHHSDLLNRLEAFKEPNAPYFTRLAAFYRSISQATAGKLDPAKLDSVVIHLGHLLYDREITLKTYQSALAELRQSVFLSADNHSADFQDLSKLSAALHREAAAIEVLAKTIRVQQG